MAVIKAGLPFFAFASAFALMPLCTVILTNGWPVNHEFHQFFDRTYVWADHFRQGDFFPIWSSSDAFGYGTPLPLYYQKLFHVINAVFFIIIANIKVATIITLYLMFMFGIYGIRAAVATVIRNKMIINSIPLIFPVTSYVTTDWFVRGAMAELSAVVIIPWLLWWCLSVLKTGKISYWIILIFPALFYAHNAIALISVIFVGITIIILLLHRGRFIELIKTSWKRILVCFIAIVGVIIPSLVLQSMMNRDYNPTDKIDDVHNITSNFIEPGKYLLDRTYVWLQSGEGYTVQVDILLWSSVVLTASCLIWLTAKKKGSIALKDATLQVVVGSLVVYCFFQLAISVPIYESVHVLSLIQFPWRMLSVIIPLLIVVLAFLIERLSITLKISNNAVNVGMVLWIGTFVLLSPLTYPNRVEKMDIRSYSDRPIYAGGEYLPITYTSSGVLMDNKTMFEMYEKLGDTPSPGVTFTNLTTEKESLERKYKIDSSKARAIELPISYSRYMDVYVNGIKVQTGRTMHDPRLVVDVPQGESEVKVELPNLVKMTKAALNL